MPGPVALVGHSSGCAIAIASADVVAHLAGLLLWEAPFGQFSGGAASWWAQVHEHIAAGRLEEAVAAYMVDMPPEWLEGLRTSPDYPELVLSWVPDGTALAQLEEGLEVALMTVTAPVVAAFGTSTFPGMAEAAQSITDAAPHGRSEALSGAWHSWDPAAMSERLEKLLRDAA